MIATLAGGLNDDITLVAHVSTLQSLELHGCDDTQMNMSVSRSGLRKINNCSMNIPESMNGLRSNISGSMNISKTMNGLRSNITV